jgi:hypothetical protein
MDAISNVGTIRRNPQCEWNTARAGMTGLAGRACIAFYGCAHQQGGLICSRVPYRPAEVLVAVATDGKALSVATNLQ